MTVEERSWVLRKMVYWYQFVNGLNMFWYCTMWSSFLNNNTEQNVNMSLAFCIYSLTIIDKQIYDSIDYHKNQPLQYKNCYTEVLYFLLVEYLSSLRVSQTYSSMLTNCDNSIFFALTLLTISLHWNFTVPPTFWNDKSKVQINYVKYHQCLYFRNSFFFFFFFHQVIILSHIQFNTLRSW